jgi:hypothetical protein
MSPRSTPSTANRPSISCWALPGFGNALLVTGDRKYVDAWRAMAVAVNSHARDEDGRTQYPTMFGADGWYGWRDTPWDVGAVEVWYWSQRSDDLPRPQRAWSPPEGSGAYASLGTSGWIDFLRGQGSNYPEQALPWDLALVEKRLKAMRADTTPPERRLADNMLDYNPAAAEALVQFRKHEQGLAATDGTFTTGVSRAWSAPTAPAPDSTGPAPPATSATP